MESVAEFYVDTDRETLVHFVAADLVNYCRDSPCNLETMPGLVRFYRSITPTVYGDDREWLITVQTVKAKQDRTLVYAACYVSEFVPAFDDMLQRISRAYPESGLGTSASLTVIDDPIKQVFERWLSDYQDKCRRLKKRVLTQEDFAEELGISRTTLYRRMWKRDGVAFSAIKERHQVSGKQSETTTEST